ncbi:uncharacterized protein LOC110457641 [Mizuhopecten yessoensis]|uniref:Uncharacterized protein n=1 Tax=Mizuhopecten yessoensis TaxID=6573 RepID=A0A210Q8C7_MIZYE|nr:uncharacterized protein LOC110457641 [Mizuhopecten yessoensis]OWF44965.1 hypothetical protein KP79_PYT13022 [Mizuhopecten yessoensis]
MLMMLEILVLYSTIVSVSLGQDPFFLLSGPPSKVIYRLDKTTKAYTDIPITQQQPSSVQYDRGTERIFFGATDEIHVYSIRLDGSDSMEEANAGMYAPAITIDDNRRYLFVYSRGSTSTIMQIKLAEDPLMRYSRVIDNPTNNITHIAADPATGTLFLGSDEGVYACSYNGTETVIALNSSASSNGITFDDNYIYAIRGNIIWRINRSSNEAKQLFTISYKTNQAAQGLAAAGGHLYFALNYCDQGAASQECDTYVYRLLKDGSQYEAFSPLIRTAYCSMLKLVYVTPFQRNVSTTSPCQEDITGACIHIVDDNYSDDSSASNNTLVICLLVVLVFVCLVSIGFFFCWKKMSKFQMSGNSDETINETLHSGHYMELTEEQKF